MKNELPYTLLVMLCLTTAGCKGEAADSSGGEQTGSAAETNGTSPTETGVSTTGGEPSHEICDRYLECIAATMPDALPPAQAGFGAGGTCWAGGTEAAQLCIDGCRTGLQQYHDAFPDEPKCFACLSKAECDEDAGEWCFGGSCVTSVCGNGILEAEEICDSQPKCFIDCQGPADCSPLTDAGCTEAGYCAFNNFPGMLREAICIAAPKNLLQVNDDCTQTSNDTRCDRGLRCVDASLLPASCTFELCCTPYCNIAMPTDCPPDTVCKPYQDVILGDFADEGLDYLGVCVAP